MPDRHHLEQWSGIVAEFRKDSVMETRPVILESWQRSRAAGIPPAPANTLLRRVDNIAERLAKNSSLVEASKPLLAEFSRSLGTLRHAVYIADRDAVVLHSVGNDVTMLAYGLAPGSEWAEYLMGTNGVGTAIATGQPVAVIGPEHYILEFHQAACMACPIHAPSGALLGAVDLSTHVGDARPEQFRGVIELALRIERVMKTAFAATAQ